MKSTSNNRSAPYPEVPWPSSPPQQPAQANKAVPLKSTLWAEHLVEKQRLQMVRLQVLQRYFVCLITGGGLGTLGGGGGGGVGEGEGVGGGVSSSCSIERLFQRCLIGVGRKGRSQKGRKSSQVHSTSSHHGGGSDRSSGVSSLGGGGGGGGGVGSFGGGAGFGGAGAR